MSWSRAFEDPIPGIRTLRDAARYIQKLPKAQQQLPHWQAATEALIMAAEGRGSDNARADRDAAGDAVWEAGAGEGAETEAGEGV